MIKRALVYIIPAALFVVWFGIVLAGIDMMISKENNNKFHAMLLGCKNLGSSKDIEGILYFDCNGKIELHKELDWTSGM